MTHITPNDIDEYVRSKITTQSYDKKPAIDGVKLVEISNFINEDGNFSELIRMDEKAEVIGFPGFCVRQINRSSMLPGSIKAWHIHYRQDEIWYVPPEEELILGVWDVRAASPTKGLATKYVIGGGKNRLLFIPKGVAHGARNPLLRQSSVIYFVDQFFDSKTPDEQRIAWDSLGETFWDTPKE